MATTISGTYGGFTNGFDGKGYELLAQALNAANRAAKHFKGRSISRTAYAAKDLLLSVLIEEDAPEVNPKWQRQPDGDWLLVINIACRLSVHAPFRRLSPAARCKVVQRIGPAPGSSAAA